MKSKLLAIFLFIGSYVFPSVTSQKIHAAHTLANLGFEDEAKQVLNVSFDHENYHTQFVSDQFVKWATKKNMEMEDVFNESAFYVVRNDRESAIKAIESKLQYYNLNAKEFSESFVDWGLGLMELRSILNKKESDK